MKEGAPIRLEEHVMPRNRLAGGIMDAVTPLWMRVAAGCHLNRDTCRALAAVGFVINALEKRWFGLSIGVDAHK